MALLAQLVAGHLLLAAFAFLFLTQPPFWRSRRWDVPDPDFVKRCAPFIALFFGLLFLHLTEVAIDVDLAAMLGADYTQAMFRFEGDFVAGFQSVTHPVLDVFLTGVYVFTYPFLIYFTPLFLILHRDRKNLAMYCVAFFAGYMMTLPFFLFLTMHDPWNASTQAWYAGRPIEFRLQTLWPEFIDSYFKFTSPNNELPSLHSQLSAMVAGVSWLAGYRRYAIFATFCAALIPLSSLYLGVHWITDIAVAELFAAVSVAAGFYARRHFADAPTRSPTPSPGAPAASELPAADTAAESAE